MDIRIAQATLALVFAATPPLLRAGETFRVSAALAHAGHAFASPVLVVAPGVPATVGMSGDEPYSLTVTVAPAQDGALEVRSDLRSSHGTMAPVMRLAPGKPGIVKVGDLSMTLTASADATP